MGILVAGTYLTRAVGTKLIPMLDKKIKEENTPIFLALIQMLGSALSFMGGKAGAITCVYCRKFADGFRVPILANMQNKEIESKYRATSLSAISLLTNLLVAMVGPILGMLNQSLGVAMTVGLFFYFGLIVVLPVGWMLKREMVKG